MPVPVVAVAASMASGAVMFLPVLPPDRLPDWVVAINYDAGETIGWPAFADSVASVHRALPPAEQARSVILTSNYGEAGALTRYGPDRGLPRAYSGHNSVADFGVPPDTADVVIVVGYSAPIWVCREPLAPWSQVWERIRVVG